MADQTYVSKEVVAVSELIDTYKRWTNYNSRGHRSYKFYHPSEWGKAQPLDSEVQTPYGMKRMGDIKVGDEVCGVKGDINRVELIHPQGLKDIYEITFADGDSARCCGNHLWEVNSSYFGFARSKILTIKELSKKYLTKQNKRSFTIRVPEPLQMKKNAPEIIPPYLMGVLLGDGCLRCNSIDFTSIDSDIVDRVKKCLQNGYEVHSWKKDVQHRIKKANCKGGGNNIYKEELIKYKLYKLCSSERFIPDEYLYVKKEDRQTLLNGLMDTDGTIDSRGYARFSTKSSKMSQQFKWLIESLGGVCIIRDKKTKLNDKIFYSYRCDIKFNNSEDLFYLSRKKKRGKKRKNKVNRVISNIEVIGKEDCQCITVSNPDGLYLTDHCIITHNCLRRQQYKHYAELGLVEGVDAELESKTLRLFDKGHNMHNRWTSYFDDIGGVLRGRWRCSNVGCFLFNDDGSLKKLSKDEILKIFKKGKARVYGEGERVGIFKPDRCVCGCEEFQYLEGHVSDDELRIKGNVDMILDCSNLKEDRFEGVRSSFDPRFLPKDGQIVVGDFKTINLSQWEWQLAKKGPHKAYMIQMMIYIYLLDVDYGILMYENKNDSEMKWYKIERNDKWWDIIKWQAKAMVDMEEDKQLPPPRYETKTNFECRKSCEFKKQCHKCGVWNNKDLASDIKYFYKELL